MLPVWFNQFKACQIWISTFESDIYDYDKMFAHQIFIKSHISMLPCCQCGSINSKLVIFEYPLLKATDDLMKCFLIKYLSRAKLPYCHVFSAVQSIQTVSNLNIYIWKGKICAQFSSWLSLHCRHGSIVAKKWEPRNPVPSCFSAQIRKVEALLGKLAKIRKVETN